VTRFHKPNRAPFPCALYELPVPAAVYQRIKTELKAFEARRAELRYTHRSMLLSLLLYIPYVRQDRYFCSHFVAEILQRGALAPPGKGQRALSSPGFHPAARCAAGLPGRSAGAFPPLRSCINQRTVRNRTVLFGYLLIG